MHFFVVAVYKWLICVLQSHVVFERVFLHIASLTSALLSRVMSYFLLDMNKIIILFIFIILFTIKR